MTVRYSPAVEEIDRICRLLISNFADDRGIGVARDLTAAYRGLDTTARRELFDLLLDRYAPDPQSIISASQAYQANPNDKAHQSLLKAVDPPRQQLFRCINMAPDGLSTLVLMRSHLKKLTVPEMVKFRALDQDLKHLLKSWFNRGFLSLRAIDWNSPASLLERIIEYEAVHQINGWDDLHGRLEQDRRCFGFFHPSMPDDPLVFVEVALTRDLASSIGPLIQEDREVLDVRNTDTAIFYSISNCHEGLRGIAFGGFLIKRAVQELQRELPQLQTFSTLSPVPAFRSWLSQKSNFLDKGESVQSSIALIQKELMTGSLEHPEAIRTLSEPLLCLCAHYLLNEKIGRGLLDPVARFHLGNGASLYRLNWLADASAKGIEQSAGIMVNYVYNMQDVQQNRESLATSGVVAASAEVKQLAARAVLA